ncbi:hypothetical protein GPALN_012167 [Globodera pallida]|nr:hypothetical protein GPALN_012167 [Globodera pallida]
MPISTESTDVMDDITADPECWPPNLANLDPSEELRLLRARIAQLERQQTTNSSTSNAIFNLLTSRRYREKLMKTERELKDTKELVGKTLEQMEECKRIAKLELNELGNSTKKEFEKVAAVPEVPHQSVIPSEPGLDSDFGSGTGLGSASRAESFKSSFVSSSAANTYYHNQPFYYYGNHYYLGGHGASKVNAGEIQCKMPLDTLFNQNAPNVDKWNLASNVDKWNSLYDKWNLADHMDKWNLAGHVDKWNSLYDKWNLAGHVDKWNSLYDKWNLAGHVDK